MFQGHSGLMITFGRDFEKCILRIWRTDREEDEEGEEEEDISS